MADVGGTLYGTMTQSGQHLAVIGRVTDITRGDLLAVADRQSIAPGAPAT